MVAIVQKTPSLLHTTASLGATGFTKLQGATEAASNMLVGQTSCTQQMGAVSELLTWAALGIALVAASISRSFFAGIKAGSQTLQAEVQANTADSSSKAAAKMVASATLSVATGVSAAAEAVAGVGTEVLTYATDKLITPKPLVQRANLVPQVAIWTALTSLAVACQVGKASCTKLAEYTA